MVRLLFIFAILVVKDCMSLKCYECCDEKSCSSKKMEKIDCPEAAHPHINFGCGEFSLKFSNESFEFKGCVPNIFKNPECKYELSEMENIDENMNHIFKNLGIENYQKHDSIVESCDICFEDLCNSSAASTVSAVITMGLFSVLTKFI